LGQLTNLRVLNVNNNQLTTLPPEIGLLTALESLFLDNNPLSSLPSEFVQLRALQDLNLYGTALVNPPLSVVEACKREKGYNWGQLQRYFDSQGIQNRNVKVRAFSHSLAR